MAFNGSGTYVLPGAALVDGQTISATEHNAFRNDVATALTTCVTRNGQSPATANLPMGGFKLTGLGAGSGAGESVRFEQLTKESIVGLTTADSPQFTALNIGHATDTTISRASAGTIAVEGVNVYTTATGAALAGSSSQAFSTAALTTTGLFDISGAAAGQIKFPATQNASADANTLDDYEEGTWTATFTAGSGTLTSVTMSDATYTKFGNVGFIRGLANIVDAGTGGSYLSYNLPFNAASANAGSGSATEVAATGLSCTHNTYTVALARILKYDNLTIIATGRQIQLSMTYHIA